MTYDRIDKFACAVGALVVTAIMGGLSLLADSWIAGTGWVVLLSLYLRATYDLLRRRHAEPGA